MSRVHVGFVRSQFLTARNLPRIADGQAWRLGDHHTHSSNCALKQVRLRCMYYEEQLVTILYGESSGGDNGVNEASATDSIGAAIPSPEDFAHDE